jgi:hypothetical protein
VVGHSEILPPLHVQAQSGVLRPSTSPESSSAFAAPPPRPHSCEGRADSHSSTQFSPSVRLSTKVLGIIDSWGICRRTLWHMTNKFRACLNDPMGGQPPKSSRSMVRHAQPAHSYWLARPPASLARIRAGGISPLIHHPSQQSTDMERLGLSDAPQELIDEIIDHCSGDKRTLIACSLISRAWVYRTRKHLFSTLTLTDRTLPVWCGIVVAPPMATGSEPQPIAGGSSSLPSHRLSSYVTSLQLVPKLFPISPRRNLCADQLVQVKSHFSAFTHLRSLTLTAVSFLTFEDATLEACFGSLAKTVWELKLWSCSLNEERFFALVRLFTLLESFHAGGDRWGHSSSIVKTEGLERERPTLRGSFTGSGFTDDRDGLLESLATAETEYHTITLGWNLPSTIAKFNALFAKCKDHLKTLSLTALERGTWHHGTSSFSLWPLPVPVRSDQRNIEQMV